MKSWNFIKLNFANFQISLELENYKAFEDMETSLEDKFSEYLV